MADIRDVISEIANWRAEGARVAVGRVVTTDGSGPRELGATMAVHEDGRVLGSVSGGCVEGAVVTEALAAIAGEKTRLVQFGYSDDEAFAVGLTCGGTIGIFIDPNPLAVEQELRQALGDNVPVALGTVVAVDELGEPDNEAPFAYEPDTPDADLSPARPIHTGSTLLVYENGGTVGSLGHPSLDRSVRRDALGALGQGRSAIRTYGARGEARGLEISVFLDAFTAPPRMVIFGAVDFTAALAKVAKILGYEVTVCDARATFATRARFPMADEVVVEWPDRYLQAHADLSARDAVCVLTHDPKFDVPAIVGAVATKVGYIGAMGSRRTHAERMTRLVDAGLSIQDLARVMAPIGLDLGARSPEEVAVSICAEIIALQTGHEVQSLRDANGPIHNRLHATSVPS